MSNTKVTFSQMRKTPENTRARDTGKSQTQKKSPHLPTTFDSYCQEKGHKLVQEVIHAARLAGPQPPAWNAGGDIRCRRPVGDLGQPRAPYPQVAALPPPHPTKPLGGCLRGKLGVAWAIGRVFGVPATACAPREVGLQTHPACRADAVPVYAGYGGQLSSSR